jgi:hypothetical protein
MKLVQRSVWISNWVQLILQTNLSFGIWEEFFFCLAFENGGYVLWIFEKQTQVFITELPAIESKLW